jgi:hypothetical protein
MVLPAWPPLPAPASCALLLRPELLHASPARPAAKRAATAVGILNISSSVCSPGDCQAEFHGDRLSLSVCFSVYHSRIHTGIWGNGIYT